VPAFVSGADYGRLVYSRAATLFTTLGRVYGQAALDRALGRYAREHRFGHPTPDDLVAAVAAEMGPGPAAALRAGLLEGGWVDFEVLAVASGAAVPPKGVFGDPKAPSPAPATTGAFCGGVTIARRGTLALPVVIALHAADGTVRRVQWDGLEEQHQIAYSGASELRAVVIDPDHRVLLDNDLTNNVRSVAPRGVAPRVLAHGAFAAQLALAVVAP